MRRGLDYHIHTFYQRCGNETLTVPAIVSRSETGRKSSIAITDHLNHLGMLDNFRLIKRDIEQVETDLEVWFGVELNYMDCDGEFAFSAAIKEDYGFEVVIGGIHSDSSDTQDPVELVDIQHRHHMRTLTDPLVDVVVHPYWFGGGEWRKRSQGWWVDLITDFPDSRITELAQASADTGHAIEVNGCAIFYNPEYSDAFKDAYVHWIARLRDAGAVFAVASDAHDISQLVTTEYVEGLLDGLNIPEAQIWRPAKR